MDTGGNGRASCLYESDIYPRTNRTDIPADCPANWIASDRKHRRIRMRNSRLIATAVYPPGAKREIHRYCQRRRLDFIESILRFTIVKKAVIIKLIIRKTVEEKNGLIVAYLKIQKVQIRVYRKCK